jgi:NAD+ kinase
MQAALLSPDGDTFSTPPTTPAPPVVDEIRPSLSRRSSRPSSIHTEYSKAEWTPGIVLESLSPEAHKINGSGNDLIPSCENTASQSSRTDCQSPPPLRAHPHKPMDSPCFLHSHLNKEASLADWLRTGQPDSVTGQLRVASSLHPHSEDHHHHPNDPVMDLSASATRTVDGSNEEDDEFGGSLTKQLADTAVGVREMSKQLGQYSSISPIGVPLMSHKVAPAFDPTYKVFWS